MPVRSPLISGMRWSNITAARAGIPSTTSTAPRRVASMTSYAACSALIDSIGSESEILNHAYSAVFRPLNSALRGLPVRIRPGEMVVTTMPSFSSSPLSARDQPVNANFAAQYVVRCGTPILPPIEPMFTMRPVRRCCMCGTT